MNPDFWRDKKVFLTGHTGFKGSWLSLWLQQLGAKVTGYALQPSTTPSLFETANVAKGMISIIGDIRDADALRKSMQEAMPDVVIHMAAQSLVRYSYANPVETYASNVMGTIHTFEAIRCTPTVRAVVNITSDKCYDNREWVWGYREIDPMGGYDPYSSSKACAELVSAAYRSSFFNPVHYQEHGVALATVRAGNVIGGGDWATDRLIPDIIRAFEKGQPVEIRSPHAVRPWQHVLEPIRGYLTLAERLVESGIRFSEGWNFGPKDEDVRPVAWVVEQIANCWGSDAKWKIAKGPHLHEAGYLKLDISKAGSRLLWQPKLNLNEALKLTVDWAKQWQGGADAYNLTLSQLKSYQQSLTD